MNALSHASSALGFSLIALLGSAVGCAAPPAEPTDNGSSQALSRDVDSVVGALPAGTYRGTGNYVNPADAGQSGTYRSEYVITASTLALHDAYGPENAPTVVSSTMNLEWTSAHELTFGLDDGKSGGRGYCLDGRCHFEVVGEDVVWFEMTITFGPNGFTTVGSKHVDGHDVYWSETLEKI